MEWIQMLAIVAAILGGIKWLVTELKFYQSEADKERKSLLQSVQNIEKELKELDEILLPPERRHRR